MKPILSIITLFLIGFPFLARPVIARSPVDRDRSIESRKHGETGEGTLEIPPGQPVPTVKLIVSKDRKKGWNLNIQTTNFTFAPENVNQPGNYREGHAHLYINGQKITRIYSDWYYLPALESGRDEITVSLNTNDHKTLTVRGKAISDTAIVEVK